MVLANMGSSFTVVLVKSMMSSIEECVRITEEGKM
jgi:hypothetical protein